jgi:glycosyltransferase involved in cell wall biosynthesis
MKDRPVLSIITISYNCLGDLQRTRAAVEPLLEDGAVEHVIVDGGSSDGTVQYIAGLSGNTVSEPDRGIYDAINKGVIRAAGEYVWIMNAGDNPNIDQRTLRIYLHALRSRDLAAGAFGSILVVPGAQETIPHRPSVRWLWLKMTIIHQSIIYKRDAHRVLGLYSRRYCLAADYDFVLRLVRDRRWRVGISALPISRFALGGSSDVRFVRSRLEAVDICARRFPGLAIISAVYYTLVWLRRRLRGGRLR